MHCADKQEVGLSGLSDASGAHAVLEHVDEGGVEFAAGMVVWREGLAPVGDLQLLASLSAEEVQAPRLFGHGGGAVVLARLSKERKCNLEFFTWPNIWNVCCKCACWHKSKRRPRSASHLHDQMFRAAARVPLAPREGARRGGEGHLFVGCVLCEGVLQGGRVSEYALVSQTSDRNGP